LGQPEPALNANILTGHWVQHAAPIRGECPGLWPAERGGQVDGDC